MTKKLNRKQLRNLLESTVNEEKSEFARLTDRERVLTDRLYSLKSRRPLASSVEFRLEDGTPISVDYDDYEGFQLTVGDEFYHEVGEDVEDVLHVLDYVEGAGAENWDMSTF